MNTGNGKKASAMGTMWNKATSPKQDTSNLVKSSTGTAFTARKDIKKR